MKIMQILKLKHTFNLLDFLFTKNSFENKSFFIIEYGKNFLKQKNSIFLKKNKGFFLFKKFFFKSSCISLKFFENFSDLLNYNSSFLLYIKIKNLYFKSAINFLFFKKFFNFFNFLFFYLTTKYGLLKILKQILNKLKFFI